MKKENRLSRSSLIVIAICLIVLAAICLLNFLNLKNINTLQNSYASLTKEDSGIIILHKSNADLNKAEDHYRIYINSWDTTERKLFLDNIDSAINDLQLLNSNDTDFSKKIYQDVQFKLSIYNSITELKKMVDMFIQSPLYFTGNAYKYMPVKFDRLKTSFFKNYFYHATDTSELSSQKKKKGLFRRIGDAFINKDEALMEKKFKKGTADEKMNVDSLQKHEQDSLMSGLSERIKNYYTQSANNQFNLRKELNEKETELAEKNITIVSDIDNKINELLQIAVAARNSAKQESLQRAQDARTSLTRISFFSLLSIIALISLLIYNIYRTNKYEEAIINAKTSAEKLATLKSRFLSNMSHEIRSPLTSIIGFTEQVSQNETNEKNIKYLDAIKVSSGHLLNTVNDILDFSKLDAGKLRLIKEPFLLQKTIDEVAFAFSLEARKKNISINIKSSIANNFCVNGDVFRFKQILYNLISNAVKFTDNGSVEIIAATNSINNKSTTATISVHDTGVGIARNELDFIFQEFAQASLIKRPDSVRSIKGTGLGLPICKMLTELQGGNIKVESTPGKGSVFTVNLPYEISSIENLKTSDKKIIINPGQNNTNKKILVIEDNELNVMLITLLLERMGYNFDVATDGEQALQLFKEKNYYLILTDINIPKLTGVQITNLVRKDADLQKATVPIIALTADAISEDFDAYYKAGINKIILKPFRENEFRQVVENYMNVG